MRTGIFLLFAGKGRQSCRFCLGSSLESELLNRNFTHLELLNFSGDGHRKVAGHFEITGNLVLGDLPLAELRQIFEGESRPWLEFDPGGNRFAVFEVWNAHDLNIEYPWAGEEKLLDLSRIDI